MNRYYLWHTGPHMCMLRACCLVLPIRVLVGQNQRETPNQAKSGQNWPTIDNNYCGPSWGKHSLGPMSLGTKVPGKWNVLGPRRIHLGFHTPCLGRGRPLGPSQACCSKINDWPYIHANCDFKGTVPTPSPTLLVASALLKGPTE